MADRLTDYLACYRYGLVVTDHQSGEKDVETDAASAPSSTLFSKSSIAPTSRVTVTSHMKQVWQQVFRWVFNRLPVVVLPGGIEPVWLGEFVQSNVALKAQEAVSSSDWI